METVLCATNFIEFFADILKYGVTGLSAIILLLSFYLLQVQNKRKNPNESMLNTIKSYMKIALIFSLVSAISSFVEAFYIPNSSPEDGAYREQLLVDLATDNLSIEVDKIRSRHEYGDRGMSKGGGLKLEAMSEEEFDFRVLRLATFNTIKYYNADIEILKKSLSKLEGRGYEFEEVHSRILDIFPKLAGIRYQWLNGAIRQGQNDLDNFEQMVQGDPNSSIELPSEVWLFTSYEDNNKPSINITYSTLEGLKSEFQLLKENI